jgi:UDP-glucose:(heptosyl)LPS alpha-1,3-glucosyltransferase
MLRIAFLKSALCRNGRPAGGLEKYTIRLVRHASSLGAQVVLLTTDSQLPTLSSYAKVVDFGKRKRSSFYHLLWFDYQCKKYLQEHPQDIVFGLDRNFCLQTHYRAGNGVHAAFLEHRRKESSWLKSASFSCNPLHRLILAMEKKTFESQELKVLFTNSAMVQKEVEAFYPTVDPKKIKVVHNGVEWNELQDVYEQGFIDRTQVMERLGLDPSKFQFLFIGNEYHRKGLPVLLQALAELDKRDFELSVVGRERNFGYFVRLARDLGLESCVHFFGHAADTKPFYVAADCVVIPSLYDPFANVTVEALSLGNFVISSCNNGGKEVIIEKKTGAVFKNLEELVDCLRQALKKPKTKVLADSIRNSVEGLDFSCQIDCMFRLLLAN